MFWDLAWLFDFGVSSAILGRWMLRREGGGGPGRGRVAAPSLGLAALVAGPVAAVPGMNADPVMVLFAPGVGGGAAFNALARTDARVL